MTKKQAIQLFEERKVRTVWDDEQEKWYFCVADVVEALTDSVNPTDYIKKMKSVTLSLLKGGDKLSPPFPFRQQVVNKGLIVQLNRVSSASFNQSPLKRLNPSSNGWHRWPANVSTRCKTPN